MSIHAAVLSLASALLLAGAASAASMPLDVKDGGKALSGDPAAGKQAFAVCGTCHAVEPGANKIGPSLNKVVGRHAASVPGFHYSAAAKSSGIVWGEQKLFDYLAAPQKVLPGTSMTFSGVKDAQKRADIIAYLKTPPK